MKMKCLAGQSQVCKSLWHPNPFLVVLDILVSCPHLAHMLINSLVTCRLLTLEIQIPYTKIPYTKDSFVDILCSVVWNKQCIMFPLNCITSICIKLFT